ncbi:PREDICTED: low affinity immunoglobulin epsilon Fc receptor [Elephantulus edwardii]|uniref:low affinity immunoglobulin epsilon Fc receptor n=1 Tax=Elephantulus edwardii TaxID=28737 RepID=UPI0003F0E644|nr:PREDICTED: low affinity immunoglobulin epsilon Fc receptor [Elephantulus edwardii]
MEERPYTDIDEPRRKRCCRRGTQIVLLGLMTTSLWAVLLALLLLWHWDTARNLKQLEGTAIQNVSQVSKDLGRHKSSQMAQKSQTAQMLKNIGELQAEQKSMKSLESEFFQYLRELGNDLSNLKSKTLNERQEASDSLERLQEEVAKLWMELKILNGSVCNTCLEKWVNFQKKCYYFGEGAQTWLQAKYACEDLHGRLVSIHSSEEQAFLSSHANKEGSWTGLQDLDEEGVFTWLDGSSVDYSNWRPGEPNNQAQGENCVMMLGPSGHWNDAYCRSKLNSWVCERLATC